ACLVEVAHLVDEPQLLGLTDGVWPVLRRAFADARARLAHPFEPARTHGGERRLQRLTRLRARPIASERLLGPLEFADLQEIDVQPQLLREEIVEVERLRRQTDRVDAGGRRAPDALAAAGCEREGPVRVVVGVTPHGALGAEIGEQRPDLFGAAQADARGPE